MNELVDVQAKVDLNLLNIFDAVMTERHVTRAAEKLDMTQSAVSNALNRLRILFDDPLFTKIPKGVQPTIKALNLWPDIHQSLQVLHNTIKPCAFDAKNSQHSYRLAMADITALSIAPKLFNALHTQSPSSKMFFVPHDPAETGRRLMRGELDFAIVVEPPRSSTIQITPLWNDDFILAVRKGHSLINKDVSLSDFCSVKHLMINEPGSYDSINIIDDTLDQLKIKRDIFLSVNHFAVAIDLLKKTDLVAVLPRRFAEMYEELVILEIPIELPKIVVYLCSHQRHVNSSQHNWFKNLVKSVSVEIETDFT
jgi:DNA-binding transcriptional LysR family regulator